jgi:hypothetical protein
MTHPPQRSAFDFFHGRWRVQHRRLAERLVGSTSWLEFTGTCDVAPLLDGAANIDDNVLDLPGGAYRAATLRAYDPATDAWSIWWLDGRTPTHLDPPLVGRFVDGIGTFFADDALAGRPIRVRFTWTATEPDRPRWEQAFSTDGGSTWETNWRMSFTRR